MRLRSGRIVKDQLDQDEDEQSNEESLIEEFGDQDIANPDEYEKSPDESVSNEADGL